jgi:hypothetical protein
MDEGPNDEQLADEARAVRERLLALADAIAALRRLVEHSSNNNSSNAEPIFPDT